MRIFAGDEDHSVTDVPHVMPSIIRLNIQTGAAYGPILILVDGNAFKLATLTTIRFNASAEAVLVAGPNILCTAGFLSWTQTLQRKITISSPGLATTTWKGWGAVPQSRMEQLGAYRSSLQC